MTLIKILLALVIALVLALIVITLLPFAGLWFAIIYCLLIVLGFIEEAGAK